MVVFHERDVRRDAHSPRSLHGASLLLAASQNGTGAAPPCVRPVRPAKPLSKLNPLSSSILHFSRPVDDDEPCDEEYSSAASSPLEPPVLQPCSTPARKRVIATLVTPNRTWAWEPTAMPHASVPNCSTAWPVQATVIASAVGLPSTCGPSTLEAQQQHTLSKKVRRRRAADGGQKHGWTKEEDALITSFVEQDGQKWSNIAALLSGRTDDAVRNRFLRLERKRKVCVLDEQEIKTGDMWTPEEDTLVVQAANQHGLRWNLIAEAVPGRSVNAVRNRYLRCVSPTEAANLAAAHFDSSIAPLTPLPSPDTVCVI